MARCFYIWLLIGCGTTGSTPVNPPPAPVIIHDTVTRTVILHDTVAAYKFISTDTGTVLYVTNVYGDGAHDDWAVIQGAINYAIHNPQIAEVMLPIGAFKISHPLYFTNGGSFFTIKFSGFHSAKTGSQAYLSELRPDFTDSFAIGIQNGRQCELSNLSIRGQFNFPYYVNPTNIQTLKWADWKDGICADNVTMPYSGICIDPLPMAGGTSGMNIHDCTIKNFVVDILLSPNGTVQDEMINIIDCDIELAKVAIAICQDQSKECHIVRLKDWGSTHTVIDCTHYGVGRGTMPYIDGMNLAGNIYQIFNCPSQGRFTGSANEIYGESIFKIGIIGGDPTPTISNSTFDFSTSGYNPDYYILGWANFEGCQFRKYNGENNRMLLTDFQGRFTGGMMEQPPIVTGLYNSDYGTGFVQFNYITMYGLSGGVLGQGVVHKINLYNQFLNDPLYFGNTYQTPDSGVVFVNQDYQRTRYIEVKNVVLLGGGNSYFISSVPGTYKVNDYLTTSGGTYQFYDSAYIGLANCHTIQIGKVKSIVGDTVKLSQGGINFYGGITPITLDYYLTLGTKNINR